MAKATNADILQCLARHFRIVDPRTGELTAKWQRTLETPPSNTMGALAYEALVASDTEGAPAEPEADAEPSGDASAGEYPLTPAEGARGAEDAPAPDSNSEDPPAPMLPGAPSGETRRRTLPPVKD